MASNLRVDSIVPSSSGNVSIGTATGGVIIPGDLGIAGVLTYEDVTNVDSVGIITARSGVKFVGSQSRTGNVNSIISSSGNSIDINASEYIYLRTATEERVRIEPDGKIGIGTNNPGKTLDVRGTGGNFVAEISNTGTGANNNGVIFSTTNAASSTIIFTVSSGGVEKLRITGDGHVLPGSNNAYDLGSTAKGWRNVYMNDLNLSNMKGDTNDVDGTQGSWTIQEGKDDLYIINRLNGKKFKIKMEEIS